jgi:hypothetical protein
MIDPQLKLQFTQVVAYAFSSATINIAGETQYSSAATTLARVENWEQLIQKFPGEFVLTTHRVYMDGSLALKRNVRIWLFEHASGASPAYAREPVMFKELPSEFGDIHHYELWV